MLTLHSLNMEDYVQFTKTRLIVPVVYAVRSSWLLRGLFLRRGASLTQVFKAETAAAACLLSQAPRQISHRIIIRVSGLQEQTHEDVQSSKILLSLKGGRWH